MSTEAPESLHLLARGNHDIVVGVSGFGSASTDPGRWAPLHVLTGRTVYTLSYDAQNLPWPEAEVPRSILDVMNHGGELLRRWMAARIAAAGASQYLARWIRQWHRAGRKVMLVGFSLGGHIVWNAAKTCGVEGVDVVLLSSAISDVPETWAESAPCGSIVNVFSTSDLVLRYLYPIAAKEGARTAVGLGPVVDRRLNGRMFNVDATDLIGMDHLWASQNLDRLMRLGLSYVQRSQALEDRFGSFPADVEASRGLTPELLDRCYRWMRMEDSAWHALGLALQGDPVAVDQVVRLDAWSRAQGGKNLEPILLAGLALRSIHAGSYGRGVAGRSRQGLVMLVDSLLRLSIQGE